MNEGKELFVPTSGRVIPGSGFVFPETNDEAVDIAWGGKSTSTGNTSNVYWWNFPPQPPSDLEDPDMTQEEMDELSEALAELAKKSLAEAREAAGIMAPHKKCECGAKHDIVPVHYSWCDAFESE